MAIVGCNGESGPTPNDKEETRKPEAAKREVAIQVKGMFKAGAAT